MATREIVSSEIPSVPGSLEDLRMWAENFARDHFNDLKQLNEILALFTLIEDSADGFGPVSYIDFDITYTNGQKEGRLQWNIVDGTLEVGMPGDDVNLQIGQELLVRVTNDEGSQINNGQVVFVSGATGSNIEVQLPIASNPLEAPLTFGLATEDIASNQKGYITVIGNVRDVDTSGPGAEIWSDGDVIYLSATTAGALTNVRPTQPNTGVVIGAVLRAHATQGVIAVKSTVIQRISLASDVLIASLSGNQLLRWDGVAGVWVNSITEILDTGDIVVPKTSGIGIKVDVTTPTFGWRDLRAEIRTRGVGGTDPNDTIYRGNLKAYSFDVNDEAWIEFHIPHDYVKGTDIFLHYHWSHNSTVVTGGTITIDADVSYAKGHDQAAFPAEVTPTLSPTASTTQYQHMVSEVQLSAISPSASQIDTDDLEPDGLILARICLTANNITSSGAVPDPFIHEVDIHYQSTNIATKSNTPDFYA